MARVLRIECRKGVSGQPPPRRATVNYPRGRPSKGEHTVDASRRALRGVGGIVLLWGGSHAVRYVLQELGWPWGWLGGVWLVQ